MQLQLEGINALDEHSKSADPVLLMEIMELRYGWLQQYLEPHDSGLAIRGLRVVMPPADQYLLAVCEKCLAA